MANALKEAAMRSTLEYDRESTRNSKPLTYDDILFSVFYLTGIVAILAGGIYVVGSQSANPQQYSALSIIGVIGVLVTSVISMFKKKIGVVFSTIISICQGLMIGGLLVAVSLMEFNTDIQPATLIFQALVGVMGATIACCAAYHFKIFRVTSKFRRISFILALGFSITYLVNIILRLVFHTGFDLYSGGILNIAISALAVIAAGMSLLTSLDDTKKLVENGAPKSARWGLGAATGIANSITWLFIEILRLLININRT